MRWLTLLGPIVISIVISLALNRFISIEAATFIGFVAFLASVIYFDKKYIKFQGGVFIRRTKKGRDFIDNTARKSPVFWRVLGNIGVVICVISMVMIFVYLLFQLQPVLAGEAGGIRLVLPGPTSAPTADVPGTLLLPWWLWVFLIAIIIIPHEFAHGIMCRIDRVRIKSVGWILFLIIPGAFVEPDEPQLKRMHWKTKMRVYAAGSFTNILVSLVIVVVLMSTTLALTAPVGVFANVVKDTPAHQANLTGAIIEIDGVPIRSESDLVKVLSDKSPNQTVTVKTAGNNYVLPAFYPQPLFFIPKQIVTADLSDVKEYRITLQKHPDREGGYLGVAPALTAVSFNGNEQAYQSVSVMLFYVWLLSFGVGLANMMPLKPLDGGLLFEEVAGRIVKNPKKLKKVVLVVSVITLILFLSNLILPILL
ncbi:MAG: site-2 protease family protein [Candidatus Aenigmarchaeota archaeon]|nr:site-2 protease family protein [Candidatus Aenigmarchaeota archaeon]